MKTLIELFDTEPIYNYLAATVFKPQKVCFIGDYESLDIDAVSAAKKYASLTGLDCSFSFVAADSNDFDEMRRKLREVIRREKEAGNECTVDVTGGRDLALVAAGSLIPDGTKVVFYDRKENVFRFLGSEETKKVNVSLTCEAFITIAGGAIYSSSRNTDFDENDWQIIPNTQEAIIDEDTWKRVQELKKHRRRNTVTGRTSLFSGLAYCADCGSKLYFCASKSIDKDAEFFRCSEYKDNRGKCTIHFIRNIMLEKLVLTAIRNVAEYISQFEPVFLYVFAKQHKLSKQHSLKMAKQNLELAKNRIAGIDRVLTKLYEDNALGKISDERFERLSSTYELEQKELCKAISKTEQDIENAEQENVDLKVFLQTIRQCTDLKELTPTIVNTLIKRIDVHNPDEKFKHRRVKIDIYFTAVGLISIPDEKELLALMDEIRNEKSA